MAVKINRDKKTFIFDDGEEIPIPKDKVKQVLRSPSAHKSKQEAMEKWKSGLISKESILPESANAFINNLSESTFGNLGDTAANYAVSGIKAFSPGEGQEEMGYIDRLLDHFYAMQEGRKEVLADQSQRNPNAALAGQIGGIGLELGALGATPAKYALPVMGAAHSETSFLEPSEKFPEVAQEAIIGTALDKFFGGIGKVAGHRSTRRGIQDAIRTAEETNAEAIQSAARATEADAARFAQESAARETEVSRIPHLQQAENEAFVNSSAQRIDRVARTLGKTPIASEAMGVDQFINEVLDSSIYAGSKEANQSSKLLETIFKGNAEGKLTGEAIQKGMKSIDSIIAKGGSIGEILSQFRNFVTEELPSKLGNYYAFEKWMPKIEHRLAPAIENDLTKAFKHSNEVYRDVQSQLGRGFLQELNRSLKADINSIFKEHSGNFHASLSDGSLANEIRNVVESNPQYQALVDNLLEFEMFVSPAKSKFGAFQTPLPLKPGFQEIKTQVMDLPNQVADRFSNISQKYLPDIQLDIGIKSGVTDRSLSQMPKMPNRVQSPPPVNPVQTYQPQLIDVPQMPEPQGVLQRLAYGLEGIGEQGLGGMVQGVKDNATTGILAKMSGVPLGKIVGGAAAAVSGLSALTSPSSMGRNFRSGLEQTARMMDAVKQRAEAYPSHIGNGVLNDPMERRSLVKEIEDDLNMRIEDKALIQSKLNRGQALIPDLGR